MSLVKIAGFTAAGLLVVAPLAGCSGSGSTGTPSASVSVPAPTPSMTLEAPVMVTEQQEDITVQPGTEVVFDVTDPQEWTLESSDPGVFEVVNGSDQGTYTTNPGGSAVAAGTSEVTFTDTAGDTRTVQVTVVTEEIEAEPPVMVAETDTEVTAPMGAQVVFAVDDPENWFLTSGDPEIFEVVQGADLDGVITNPGGTGLSPGETEVTFTSEDGASRTVQVTVTQ